VIFIKNSDAGKHVPAVVFRSGGVVEPVIGVVVVVVLPAIVVLLDASRGFGNGVVCAFGGKVGGGALVSTLGGIADEATLMLTNGTKVSCSDSHASISEAMDISMLSNGSINKLHLLS